MKIEVFDFEFEHNGKVIPANCTVYTKKGETLMPYKYPMYRVALKTKKINPPIYLLYRTNEPGASFIWYPAEHKPKGMIEKSIAAGLEKVDLETINMKVLHAK